MPDFVQGNVTLHYEEVGSGMPLLLIAPGGMKSAIAYWQSMPWNPLVALADKYRVIAMDQRNAGSSTAPVTAADSWDTYTRDQLALLDHLGVERFHVMGMCIGGPYAMGLIQAASERVASAVLFQSIGLHADGSNRQAFYAMFDGWADELKSNTSHADVAEPAWQQFRSNMYDGDDFLFSVGDDFVRSCATPLLVLEGNDLYHPQETSQRIGELAPNVQYIEHWKDDDSRGPAMAQVSDFLAANSG